jgi:hypothetical protein
MPLSSRHAELARYAGDIAVIATSRQPTLLVKYLETYISDLERWLCEWRIPTNVSKSSVMLFAKTGRRISKLRSVHLYGEPIQWVDYARYLGVTLYKRLIWSTHTDQVRKKEAQRTSHKQEKRFLNRNGVLVYKQLIRPMMDYACPVW